MNIKGQSRAGARELARHLSNAETNETVKIWAVVGTISQDLHGAFREMEAVASGTRCKKPLYHAKISPDPKEPALTPEQWNRAIEALRDQLGLAGHAYAAVLHRKYGAAHPDVLREHLHVVFSRINPDTMRAMHDGHNYRKHELVSRQLEKEFGHARIQGAHVDREGVERPHRTPPDWAMQQAVKSGIQPRKVADTVKQLWSQADTARSFAAALPEHGLTLALGKRDLVVLDAAGGVHTLARCLDLRVADIRQRMADIDRSKIPTVEQAREAIRERTAEREKAAPVLDRAHANDNPRLRGDQEAIFAAALQLIQQRGTLAGGSKARKSPAGESGGPQRAEINALAAMLQKQIGKEERREDVAEKERLTDFGFDASKTTALDKWRELGGKVDAGKITEKDRFREMASYLWHEADKERRAAHKQEQLTRDRHREPDRER